MRIAFLLLLIATAIQAQPACDLLRVNQLAPNEIELVLGCDVERKSFTAGGFTVTGDDGTTTPAIIIELTRPTTTPPPTPTPAFSGLRLLLAQPMTSGTKYTLHVQQITAHDVSIKDKTKEVTTTGTIITNRLLPSQVFVTFPGPVTDTARVTITRAAARQRQSRGDRCRCER